LHLADTNSVTAVDQHQDCGRSAPSNSLFNHI